MLEGHARSMDKARSGAGRYGRVCVMQTRLSQLALHAFCVVWKSSRKTEVKFEEAFEHPGFGKLSGEWTGFDVDNTDDPNCDWGALMTRRFLRKAQDSHELHVDGVSMKFSKAPQGIKGGIVPRQHRVSHGKGGYQRDRNRVLARLNANDFIEVYKPLCLSLPSNDGVKTRLTSLSTRSTNRYLVTRVIQCPPDPCRLGSSITPFCIFAKPFIWLT
ncbi:hypothetical protein SCLCIDRAFT_908621 [Scleroderma citrinum Foug A]|uniref:Uncharacterized protein n=1 Tax=Scleroderma citrinum Foug A TaxID=1036808 RepID=A0A0C3A8Z5_9AGAM|nr:hypothetical protein SCLCIDRAFT_908621 [Scleroderma citrinum Foug A]